MCNYDTSYEQLEGKPVGASRISTTSPEIRYNASIGFPAARSMGAQVLQRLTADPATAEVLVASPLVPPPEGGLAQSLDHGVLVVDRLPHWGYDLCKRVLDAVLATVLLLVFLPVLALIAVLIPLTSGKGPIFFHQMTTLAPR